jgi:serine/threonine protein kinase
MQVYAIQGCADVSPLIYFVRELITQLYIQHPVFHQLLSWNMSTRDTPVKLCLSFPPEQPNQLHIDRVAGLNPTEKRKVVNGIAREMLHLYSLKIIHRDLKLTSIFIDSQNRPKIGNLWFAKHQRKDDLPRSYRLALTVHHAPEVLAGVEATLESDVFSYAILCYEVIECRQALITGVKS